MDESHIIETLKYRSQKIVPMVPTTVRLPIPLEDEMREFCATNNIIWAVLVREAIARGWREIKQEATS